MDLSEEVFSDWNRWASGLTDVYPAVHRFIGMATQPEYWALYREAKRARYAVMYRSRYFHTPGLPTYDQFERSVDDAYGPQIKEDIWQLPKSRPMAAQLARLKRKRY